MDTPLIPTEKQLLAIAADNLQTIKVWSPHIDDIAAQMGISRPHVFTLLRKLEKRGLVEKWDGRAGVYLVLPKISEAIAAEMPTEPEPEEEETEPAKPKKPARKKTPN